MRPRPDQPPTYLLKSRGKEWSVEASAVGGDEPFASFAMCKLVRESDAVLLAVPTRAARVWAGVVCVVAWLAFTYLITALVRGLSPPADFWGRVGHYATFFLFFGLAPVVGLILALFMATQTLRIDTDAGTITRAWALGTRKTWKTDDAVGVQAVFARRYRVKGGREYDDYQVILLLAGRPVERVHLMSETVDRGAGPRHVDGAVKEFVDVLRVPPVDQVAESRRAWEARFPG